MIPIAFRPTTDADMPEITRWFLYHNKANNVKTVSNLGILCYSEAILVAAVWLYPTMSPICFSENMVANPDVPGRLRLAAFYGLVREAEKRAKKMGFSMISTSVDMPLSKKLRKSGWGILGDLRMAKEL